MVSLLFCTRFLRDDRLLRRSSSQFLSFAAAREHMRGEGLRTRAEFVQWSNSGQRPAFIPSNPDRSFRQAGWDGFADFLGCVRESRRQRQRDPKRVECIAQAESEKDALIESIIHHQPNIEIKQLPPRQLASHIFRIRDDREDCGDAWVPIQVRYVRLNPTRGRLLQVFHTAPADCPVLVLSKFGVVAGLRGELGDNFREPDFAEVAALVPSFEAWWLACTRLSKDECIRKLRIHSFTTRKLWSTTVPLLERAYFDPLGLSVTASDESRTRINAILGGQYRILMRGSTCYLPDYYYAHLATKGRAIDDETDRVDFVIAILPDSGNNGGEVSMFVFPRTFLLQNSYISSGGRGGKHSMYLYPPWKSETRKSCTIHKAEQAPFFVDSVGRFAEILKEYGGTGASDPVDCSEKLEGGDSEPAKLSL